MRAPINEILAINSAEFVKILCNLKNKYKDTVSVNLDVHIPLKNKQNFENKCFFKIQHSFILYKLRHRIKVI